MRYQTALRSEAGILSGGNSPLEVFDRLLDATCRRVDHRVGACIQGFTAGEDAPEVFHCFYARAPGGVEWPHIALRDNPAHVLFRAGLQPDTIETALQQVEGLA